MNDLSLTSGGLTSSSAERLNEDSRTLEELRRSSEMPTTELKPEFILASLTGRDAVTGFYAWTEDTAAQDVGTNFRYSKPNGLSGSIVPIWNPAVVQNGETITCSPSSPFKCQLRRLTNSTTYGTIWEVIHSPTAGGGLTLYRFSNTNPLVLTSSPYLAMGLLYSDSYPPGTYLFSFGLGATVSNGNTGSGATSNGMKILVTDHSGVLNTFTIRGPNYNDAFGSVLVPIYAIAPAITLGYPTVFATSICPLYWVNIPDTSGTVTIDWTFYDAMLSGISGYFTNVGVGAVTVFKISS